MTLDILLSYYQNPVTLHRWLTRLLCHSDLLRYSRQVKLVICDTGTPKERVPETLKVLRRCEGEVPITYIRVDTDAVRAAGPDDAEVRPTPLVYNTALRHACSGELVMFTILSHIPTPKYFEHLLARHAENERLVLQPYQILLDSSDYWDTGYKLPFEKAIENRDLYHWNGMPDWSIRRKWLEQIGAWDEDYVCWSMADIDLCARLTGKTDAGVWAHEWLSEQNGGVHVPVFENLGLELSRPRTPEFFSLICNGYSGHLAVENEKRKRAMKINFEIFLKKWGVVKREGKTNLPYEVVEI